MSKLQVTLALLKPDVAINCVACRCIIQKMKYKNLSIVSKKVLHWKREDSEEFYKKHEKKFFFRRLVEYTSYAPIIALLVVGRNAIQSWRDIIGPTKTFQSKLSHPYTVRGEFGLSDTRNSSHGSDSQQSLEEIQLIFPEFNFRKWIRSHNKNELFDQKQTSLSYEQDGTNEIFSVDQLWQNNPEQRYSIEWFTSYPELRNTILSLIQETIAHKEENSALKVIDIGCGNSVLGPHIALDLKNDIEIYCIDFTMDALNSLQQRVNKNEKFNDLRNCFFVYHDVTSPLPFNSNEVGAIIDKGSTDAIIKQKGLQSACKALQHMLNSLQKNGTLIQITDEPPEIRMDILQEVVGTFLDCSFHISCKEIDCLVNFEYFVYTVIKS